jgi:hypothetical protein
MRHTVRNAHCDYRGETKQMHFAIVYCCEARVKVGANDSRSCISHGMETVPDRVEVGHCTAILGSSRSARRFPGHM